MDTSPKTIFALTAGVVGGAAMGKMAFDHFFVEGMDDKERTKLIGIGVGAGVVFGLAYLFGIDEKWLTGKGEVEVIESWVGP